MRLWWLPILLVGSLSPAAQVDFVPPASLQGAGEVVGLHSAAWDVAADEYVLQAERADVTRVVYAAVDDSDVINVVPIREIDREERTLTAATLTLSGGEAAGMLTSATECSGLHAEGLKIAGVARGDGDYATLSHEHLPFPRFVRSLEVREGDLALEGQRTTLVGMCDALGLDLYGVSGSIGGAEGTWAIDAGPSSEQRADPVGRAGTHVYFFMELRGVAVDRWPASDVIAGYAADAQVAWGGDAQLPRATASELPDGAVVDEAGSILLRGNFTMEGFADRDGRMQARVGGDPEVWLNSEPLTSAAVPIAPAATASLVTLALALLAKYAYASALFTRLPADEALKHPRRQALYAYIQEQPGATFRELVRETGVPAGTCRHHLSVLQRADVIVERRHRATVRFFENHGKYDDSWESVVMLREPELARVHGFIKDNPRVMQKEVLEHAQSWGWSRSTTQHRLQRLVDAGVIEVTEIGRRKEYSVRGQRPTAFHPLSWRSAT